MTRLVSILLLVLAGWGLLPMPAQEPEVIFRSDVSLVRVDAQAVDRDNRAITGLGPTDFVIREDGKPQEIRDFSKENMPVDILLLLDVSGSMRPHVERIAAAADRAMQVFGSEDRVAIMVFDRASRVRMPFRSGREEVRRGLDLLLNQETFDGGTDVTRGLLDAAAYVERNARRDARRAIVILTDDQTERNRDEAAVARALTRADAVLSALLAPDAIGGGRPSMRVPQGGGWPGGWPNGPLGGIILGPRSRMPGPTTSRTQSAGTAEIARRSGGDSMQVDDASALETTLARIRQRYALYFYLPDGVAPGQERAIEVQLSDAARRRYPNAEVRYRRVYLAPGGATGQPAEATPAPLEIPPLTKSPSAPEPPVARRRPAVNQDGPRQGPLDVAGGSPAAPPQPLAQPQSEGGWRRVDEPGWRRAK